MKYVLPVAFVVWTSPVWVPCLAWAVASRMYQRALDWSSEP